MMGDTPERHKDTWRNAVLNKAVHSLDKIINRHDPEVDCPVNQGVWDFLDKLVLAFEERQRADTATPAPAVPLADPRVVTARECLERIQDYALGDGMLDFIEGLAADALAAITATKEVQP